MPPHCGNAAPRGWLIGCVPDFLLALLDPGPKLILHDPEFRYLDDLTLFGRIDPGDTLTGPRVFYIACPVPLQPVDVDWVVQDSRSTIPLPPDCGVVPEPAIGRLDLLRAVCGIRTK